MVHFGSTPKKMLRDRKSPPPPSNIFFGILYLFYVFFSFFSFLFKIWDKEVSALFVQTRILVRGSVMEGWMGED